MLAQAYTISDVSAGAPEFTRWIVSSGALSEPFVLIDAGVNGGFHPRWRALEDQLHAIGFDPVPSVIEDLERDGSFVGKTEYRLIALSESDGAQVFYVQEDNTTNSGFYASENGKAVHVSTRSFDSLYSADELPPADFVKLDCEGAEPFILKGGSQYLNASCFYGLQTECSFRCSAVLPDGHFGAIFQFFTDNYLELYSICHDNYLRPLYAERIRSNGVQPENLNRFGAIGTSDALFVSDIVKQKYSRDTYDKMAREPDVTPFRFRIPSAEKIVKIAIVFELYGLRDCALELIDGFREEIGTTIDVEKAGNLLSVTP